MNNNKTLNEKIEMDLINLNKEYIDYITDIIPVDISKFNLFLDISNYKILSINEIYSIKNI